MQPRNSWRRKSEIIAQLSDVFVLGDLNLLKLLAYREYFETLVYFGICFSCHF